MGHFGMPEILIIFAVILLLFGGAKLPELARSLGTAKREFKKAQEEVNEPVRGAIADSSADKKKPAFCQYCGGPLPEGSDKCPKCGGQ